MGANDQSIVYDATVWGEPGPWGRLLCTQASAGEAKFNVEEECSLPASALWENMEEEGELFAAPADSSTIFQMLSCLIVVALIFKNCYKCAI